MHMLVRYAAAVIVLCFSISQAFAQVNINRIEYYIDTDPGYGRATMASFAPNAPDVNATITVPTVAFSPGLHIVGVRSRDDSGRWSMDERWLVLKQAAPVAATNIEKAEWYLDTDPGYGNANPVSGITPGPDLANLSFSSNSPLTPGLHIIGVRSQSTDKIWSMDERWLILKQDTAVLSPAIDRVEWYRDTDPGYGNGTAIPITPGQDLQNLPLSVLTGSLSPGLHIIGIRSRDTKKAWSLDERWLVLKPDTAVLSAAIERVEWYRDTDPGYGNATPISITPGLDLVNLSFTADSLLNPGLHIVGVRSKAANGAWSLDERWLILKKPQPPTIPNIKRIEYYIDTDPGKGKGIPIAFFPARDVVSPPTFVNVTGLSAGPHKLLIRSVDTSNVWSFDDTLSFTIAMPVAAPFINVNSVAFTNVCAAGTFTLGYHATGTYNAGNQFIAEISDAQGSFTGAQNIGNLTSTEPGGIITCNMPQGIQGGSGFKMRVRSTNPPLTGNGSNQSLSVSISNFFLGNDTFSVVACAEQRVNITQFYNPANSQLTWSVADPTAAPVGVHSVFAINSIGCKDTAIITVSLPTATWTGAISTNWHLPGNWSTNAVPADTTHVIIPAEVARECIISASDAVAASVHVKAGAAAVRILNGRKLLIKATCATVPD